MAAFALLCVALLGAPVEADDINHKVRANDSRKRERGCDAIVLRAHS